MGDDRVYLSNDVGFVDNVNSDPIGFHVDWKDENGDPCAAPKGHPGGFQVIGISDDETVTCRVESSGSTYKFHNPVRNIEFYVPRQSMTVKELEEHMNNRFA